MRGRLVLFWGLLLYVRFLFGKMEGNMVIGVVVMFVVLGVLMLAGVQIMGSTSTAFDCKSLQGYNASGATDALKYPSGTWAGSCHATQGQIQDSYGLIVVILVIVAASAILLVVRSFSQ